MSDNVTFLSPVTLDGSVVRSCSLWTSDMHDDGTSGETRMKSEVSLGGRISAPSRVSSDLDAVREDLRLKAVSMFDAGCRAVRGHVAEALRYARAATSSAVVQSVES